MIDIQEASRTGKSGRTYRQFYVDGKLVGCGCDEAKAVTIEKYGYKPCHHMSGRKALVVVEQEPFVPEYGCELCGRRVGRAYMVCAKCGGV